MVYYLKYYRKENIKYSEYNTIRLNKLETVGFCYYVCGELKIPMVRVAFRKMKNLGLFNEKNKKVTFQNKNNISLLTVAHELGHYLDVHRNGSYELGYNYLCGKKKYRKAHTKKHEQCLKMILKIYDNIKGGYIG